MDAPMVTTTLGLTSALNTYAASTSTSGKTTTTANQATTSAIGDSASTAASAKSSAATSNTVPSTKLVVARQHLNLLQHSLAKDIRAALSKAGQSLTGTVDFRLTADGKLSMSGNDKDKAKVAAVLAADKSVPSLSSRLTDLNKQAASFDRQSVQSNAAMAAARQAGKGAQNLMTLYQSMMTSQTASTAVFSLSDKGSQVAFSGALAASA